MYVCYYKEMFYFFIKEIVFSFQVLQSFGKICINKDICVFRVLVSQLYLLLI